MIIKDSHGYLFTVQDLFEQCGGSINTMRSRVARMTISGQFKHHSKKRPSNQNIYISRIDPLVVLNEKDEEIPVHFITGFFNNPFKLKNAIDMRWRYEEVIS
jgi:hypothetical protein